MDINVKQGGDNHHRVLLFFSVGDKLTPKVICVLTPEAAKVNLYPAVSFHELFYMVKKVNILCEFMLRLYIVFCRYMYKHLSFIYIYLHVLHASVIYMYTVVGTVREFR